MIMHLLSGGRLRMRKSIFVPTSDRAATIELPVFAALLRHAQGNVLFDTGCHPAVPDDPETRWGGLSKFMTPIMRPGDNVLTGLAALGLDASDIDVVINSHLHTDHCGCNAFFKNATFLAHALEIEAANAKGSESAGYVAADLAGQPAFDALQGERDLFGDGRIVLIHLPGHSPGSIGALVQLDRSGRFLLAADTVALHDVLTQDVLPRNTWNPEVLAKSLEEVRRIEAGGATVLCGHDAAQWDSLRKGADAYD